MKKKLAQSHEKPIVSKRKLPNFAKNCSRHSCKGNEARRLVIIPLKTATPIVLKPPKVLILDEAIVTPSQ
eukprot:TRINITY_DN8870_c0_g1_i1.p3 TRINITY_DN8870_c0_g1~~TRINITY_DN8870_c0_g1_i1.p3  ORF type:complete len:70 (-),score=3.06 TRINITY_DN8870_c0_g1_i1:666-875(-)